MKRVSSLRQNVLRVVRIRVVSIKETFRREAIQAHQRGEDVKEFCICRLKEVAEASAALVERLTERLDQNHSDQDQANGILRAGGYCRCAARQMRRWGTGKIALGTVCAVIAFFANQEQFLVVMSLMMAMVSAALLTIVTVVGFHQFLEGYWEKDELRTTIASGLVIAALTCSLVGAYLRAEILREQSRIEQMDGASWGGVVETPDGVEPIRTLDSSTTEESFEDR